MGGEGRDTDSNVFSWKLVGRGTRDTVPRAPERVGPGQGLVALSMKRSLAASG